MTVSSFVGISSLGNMYFFRDIPSSRDIPLSVCTTSFLNILFILGTSLFVGLSSFWAHLYLWAYLHSGTYVHYLPLFVGKVVCLFCIPIKINHELMRETNGFSRWLLFNKSTLFFIFTIDIVYIYQVVAGCITPSKCILVPVALTLCWFVSFIATSPNSRTWCKIMYVLTHIRQLC